MAFNPTQEQLDVLNNDKKMLVVSASAGSGKTSVVIEYICNLVCKKKVPVKRLLVLTFTKAAANEMRERLLSSLMEQKPTAFLLEQIDDLSTSDICTIDSFCEKIIRRNIEKLDLDEAFTVLDEENGRKFARQVFEKICADFAKSDAGKYNEVYFAFRKDKNRIFECLYDINAFCGSISSPERFVSYAINEAPNIEQKSQQILFQELLKEIKQLYAFSQSIKAQNEKVALYVSATAGMLKNLLDAKDIFSLAALKAQPLSFPRITGQAREEEGFILAQNLHENFKTLCTKIAKFDLSDALKEKCNSASLPIAIMSLYHSFVKAFDEEKARLSMLDFADIEKYARSLLNGEILEDLQSSYDFVFVDEYQDTNFVQDSIIKPIAQKGKFIAVGDPKQGIYGFRNASMEIMLNDIALFDESEDGDAKYLRGNFRSDKRILDFINKIFVKIMRGDNCGIDYQKTSMLVSPNNFQNNSDFAVQVDIVKSQEEEKEPETGIYSVRDAVAKLKNKNLLEAKLVCARVDELLSEKIYDQKTKEERDATYSDIVILLRNRSALMSEIAEQLKAHNIPFVSAQKQNLTEDGQIAVLLSLLKLCVDKNDEYALASVLLSKIGGLSEEEAGQIVASRDMSFCENIYSLLENQQKNDKISSFFENFEEFKLDASFYGVRYAFERLFIKTDYFAYLESLGGGKEELVEQFLSSIETSGYDFDIPMLLSYFENMSQGKTISGESEQEGVQIMTIHASKGLEFPFVILAGCGKNIDGGNVRSYLCMQELGFACQCYDFELNKKGATATFELSKSLKSKRERIDELMIFYVALTRAKNKLYLTGQYDVEKFDLDDKNVDIFKAKSYFDWIFAALGKNLIAKLKTNDKVVVEDCNFNLVTEIYDKIEVDDIIDFKNVDLNLRQELVDYFNFSYPYVSSLNVLSKDSVTHLNHEGQSFAPSAQKEISTPEEGTAYHHMLELLDFDKINSADDLKNEIERLLHGNYLSEDEIKFIDEELLLKNIKLLKNLTQNKKIFKEKQFVMRHQVENDEKFTLIQGVVDLFALGDENIVVDYKFSSLQNEETLKKRYSKQIEFYATAIEKAFNKKIDKKYLLSLKYAKLFEF